MKIKYKLLKLLYDNWAVDGTRGWERATVYKHKELKNISNKIIDKNIDRMRDNWFINTSLLKKSWYSKPSILAITEKWSEFVINFINKNIRWKISFRILKNKDLIAIIVSIIALLLSFFN